MSKMSNLNVMLEETKVNVFNELEKFREFGFDLPLLCAIIDEYGMSLGFDPVKFHILLLDCSFDVNKVLEEKNER